jgi:S1-C subfamily serine protease
MKRTFVAAAIAAAFTGGLALSGLVENSGLVRPSFAAPQAAESAVSPTATLSSLPDFSALVEREGPAVVNIAVSKKAADEASEPPLLHTDVTKLSRNNVANSKLTACVGTPAFHFSVVQQGTVKGVTATPRSVITTRCKVDHSSASTNPHNRRRICKFVITACS